MKGNLKEDIFPKKLNWVLLGITAILIFRQLYSLLYSLIILPESFEEIELFFIAISIWEILQILMLGGFGYFVWKRKKVGYYGLIILTALLLVFNLSVTISMFPLLFTSTYDYIWFFLFSTFFTLLDIAIIILSIYILKHLTLQSPVIQMKKKTKIYKRILIIFGISFFISLLLSFEAVINVFDPLLTGKLWDYDSLKLYLEPFVYFLYLIFFPLVIIDLVGIKILYSKFKPVVSFLIIPSSLGIYNVILWSSGMVFRGMFSGEMGGLFFLYLLFLGNIIVLIYSIISSIIIYKKKKTSNSL